EKGLGKSDIRSSCLQTLICALHIKIKTGNFAADEILCALALGASLQHACAGCLVTPYQAEIQDGLARAGPSIKDIERSDEDGGRESGDRNVQTDPEGFEVARQVLLTDRSFDPGQERGARLPGPRPGLAERFGRQPRADIPL